MEVLAAHRRTRQTYVAERLHDELADHGVMTSLYRVRKLRKKLGLRCKQKRKFKVTTDSRHKLPVAPNLLDQRFAVSHPNQVWVSDITYIPTDEGWLYLAGLRDLFNGELVGYVMNERMSQNLVMQALFRAVAAKRPDKGLIHHSDRGSQYCAHAYQKLLWQFGMTASMSRKGNCWENEVSVQANARSALRRNYNAPMESFWGSLKNELAHHRQFATRQEAVQEVSEYIEVFYNQQRKQKRLGFLSPVHKFKNLWHSFGQEDVPCECNTSATGSRGSTG